MSGANLTQIIDGDTPLAATVMSNFNALNNKFNVGLDNTDIAANAGISLSKLAGDTWTTWTPTWTNFTVGAATITARYSQVGKIVHFYISVVLSGSTMGSSPRFTLPVTANSSFPLKRVFLGHIEDSGTDHFQATGIVTSTTQVELVANTAGSTYVGYAQVTSTAPMTWANSDNFTIIGTYEAA